MDTCLFLIGTGHTVWEICSAKGLLISLNALHYLNKQGNKDKFCREGIRTVTLFMQLTWNAEILPSFNSTVSDYIHCSYDMES